MVGQGWLAADLARDMGVSRKEARAWLVAVTALIAAHARTKHTVVVPALGTFKLNTRKARISNLRCGSETEPRALPAQWRLKFTPSKINKGAM